MRAMFKEHTAPINGTAFSHNGRSLVSAYHGPSVRIWNLRDGSSNVMPVIGKTLWLHSGPMDGTLQGGISVPRSGYGTRLDTSLWQSGRDI